MDAVPSEPEMFPRGPWHHWHSLPRSHSIGIGTTISSTAFYHSPRHPPIQSAVSYNAAVWDWI